MALLKAIQVSMQEPLNIVTNIFYLDPKKKKTIYTGKLPTSKRRTRNLFGGFLLITTTTGMESKLAKSYN